MLGGVRKKRVSRSATIIRTRRGILPVRRFYPAEGESVLRDVDGFYRPGSDEALFEK